MIIEINLDESADKATKQIKKKRYTGKLAGYGKEILNVGISYNMESADKKHEYVIENCIV